MVADPNILKITNLNSGYGEIEALHDVSIQVKQGQIVSIIGANGAGKSTLLKTIFGLLPVNEGGIYYKGENINNLTKFERLHKGISYVPEGRANFFDMTVQENLEMGAFIRKDAQSIFQDIEDLCQRFPILKEKRHTPAGNLSGGQQQMLEIAIALMLKPELLLIDEPTLGLAPILVTEVFNELQKINAEGTTILLVEQNAKRALEISDYGFVIELGYVNYHGPAEELIENEQVFKAYLGER